MFFWFAQGMTNEGKIKKLESEESTIIFDSEVDFSEIRERTKGRLNEKLKAAEELLESIDCSKLSDKGERLRNNIKNINNMLTHVENDSEEVVRKIYKNVCLNQKEEMNSNKSQTKKPKGDYNNNNSNSIKEDDNSVDSLIASVTKRFSKLGVNDYVGPLSHPESDERWTKLIMGNNEYEECGGPNRNKTSTIPFEEAIKIDEVIFFLNSILCLL